MAAAGGGLAVLAARHRPQHNQERSQHPAGGGYPWKGISSGERVAAAGGGLAVLAARHRLLRH